MNVFKATIRSRAQFGRWHTLYLKRFGPFSILQIIFILSIITKRLRSLAPGGVHHEIQVRQIGEGAYGNEGKKEIRVFKTDRGNNHCSKK